MAVLKRGMRLSVIRVTPEEFEIVRAMGRGRPDR
jgi:predicted RNA-binding protein with PUA-like domain